jgi:hypothetical protein
MFENEQYSVILLRLAKTQSDLFVGICKRFVPVKYEVADTAAIEQTHIWI